MRRAGLQSAERILGACHKVSGDRPDARALSAKLVQMRDRRRSPPREDLSTQIKRNETPAFTNIRQSRPGLATSETAAFDPNAAKSSDHAVSVGIETASSRVRHWPLGCQNRSLVDPP